MFLYYKPPQSLYGANEQLNLQERNNRVVSISPAYLTMKTFFGRTFIMIFWKSIIPQSVVSKMLI